jgi:hypothetical protein
MQEHFARKFKTIKDTNIEMETHRKQLGSSSVQQQPAASESKASKHFSSTRGSSAVDEEKEAQRKQQAEKQWIKVAKNTTHNFHLRNLQQASAQHTKVLLTFILHPRSMVSSFCCIVSSFF